MIESEWLKHPRIWWTVACLVWVGILVQMLANRDPPSDFQPQTSIPTGHPGETVRVEIPVKRNLERQCSVTSSRTFLDANHAADTLSTGQNISAEGLALREKLNPGKLVFNVPIPKTAATGIATVITDNQYFCPYNPTTWVKRIDDAWDVQILVTPAPKVSP